MKSRQRESGPPVLKAKNLAQKTGNRVRRENQTVSVISARSLAVQMLFGFNQAQTGLEQVVEKTNA